MPALVPRRALARAGAPRLRWRRRHRCAGRAAPSRARSASRAAVVCSSAEHAAAIASGVERAGAHVSFHRTSTNAARLVAGDRRGDDRHTLRHRLQQQAPAVHAGDGRLAQQPEQFAVRQRGQPRETGSVAAPSAARRRAGRAPPRPAGPRIAPAAARRRRTPAVASTAWPKSPPPPGHSSDVTPGIDPSRVCRSSGRGGVDASCSTSSTTISGPPSARSFNRSHAVGAPPRKRGWAIQCWSSARMRRQPKALPASLDARADVDHVRARLARGAVLRQSAGTVEHDECGPLDPDASRRPQRWRASASRRCTAPRRAPGPRTAPTGSARTGCGSRASDARSRAPRRASDNTRPRRRGRTRARTGSAAPYSSAIGPIATRRAASGPGRDRLSECVPPAPAPPRAGRASRAGPRCRRACVRAAP